MAQLVAHLLCKQGVTGSSPVGSTSSRRGPARTCRAPSACSGWGAHRPRRAPVTVDGGARHDVPGRCSNSRVIRRPRRRRRGPWNHKKHSRGRTTVDGRAPQRVVSGWGVDRARYQRLSPSVGTAVESDSGVVPHLCAQVWSNDTGVLPQSPHGGVNLWITVRPGWGAERQRPVGGTTTPPHPGGCGGVDGSGCRCPGRVGALRRWRPGGRTGRRAGPRSPRSPTRRTRSGAAAAPRRTAPRRRRP